MTDHNETKDIEIIIISILTIIVIILMCLTKPAAQDHANAISEKIDGRVTTLKNVLTPSLEYNDLVVISTTTLDGTLLTIGIFEHVFVYAKFRLIQSEN